MKKSIHPTSLPMLTLVLGGVGMLLRFWLLSGIDEERLLKARHPAAIMATVLTIGLMVLLFLSTRKLKSQGKYRINFPASVPAAVCCVLAGLALLLRGMSLLLGSQTPISTAAGICCVLAAACMLLTGMNRRKGSRSAFVLHVVVCVSFALQLLIHYQNWTSCPVIHLHFYRMLSTAGLMLTFYHRAEFDLRIGTRRRYAFIDLCTLFFCLMAVPEGDGLFYLVMAAWLLTNQCALILPRRRRPLTQETDGDATEEPEPPAAEIPAESGQEEV